jgi:hypothetical protein
MRMRHPVRCLVLGIAASAWAASAVPAQEPPAMPGLTSILDDCGTPSLGAQGRRVKDRTATIGHLEISVNEGIATPIVGKSGRILGFYVDGAGGYHYTAGTPEDRASFEANLARVAKSLRPLNGGLTDRFSKMLVLFSQPVLAELWDEAHGGETAAAPAPGSGFTEILGGALSSYPEFDFRTALAQLNGKGRYAYVEFTGGLERVGYVYDEVVDGRERLFNFRKLSDYAVRFTETLSVQTIPGWTRDRDAWIVLTQATIALETADNKSGSIVSDVTYHVHGTGTRLLALALLNNRDPDSASWDSPRNRLDVKGVTDADGKPLPFSHKYGELLVEIPATVALETDVRVHVDTGGDVFLDMNDRHTDNYFIFDNSSWFPSPASWGGERFSYTLKVRTKKPWRPVTSGKETLFKEEGESVVVESRGDHASRHIAVLGGKYVTREETIEGLTVRVHAYAMARKNVIDNLPKLTAALVKFYTGMLGAMPAEELDVVEIPEYGFGVSPSGIVLLTSEAYKAREDDIAAYLSRGINARLAHEVAHQWFGHKAWQADPADQWLGESFAEYFSGLAMGALAANDKTVVGLNRMLAEWRADSKLCVNVAPISMANSLGGEHGGAERRCLLYSRGPLVLHMLRTSIGNDRFFGATKKFLDAANTGPVTTDDYAKAISAVVQMDMDWYFDQWVRRTGDAQVDVEQHLDEAAGGQYRLWGTVRQSPGDGFKKLLVPLVWENGGKTEARVVFADQPEKKFEFLLPAKPGTIKPDPFQNNLAVYK